MLADIPSPTLDAATSRDRSHPSSLARSAGWAAAAILLGLISVHSYWAAGGGWASDPSFQPRFDPLVQNGVVCVLLIGAGALLLARIGVPIVTAPMPLLRIVPGALSGIFAVIGLSIVLAPPVGGASDWQVDVLGPLLLVLAVLCAIVAGAEPGPEELALTRAE